MGFSRIFVNKTLIEIKYNLRRWRFATKAERVYAAGKKENAAVLPDADVTDLGDTPEMLGYIWVSCRRCRP